MNLTDKIFVAGHKGLVGSSIIRLLIRLGYTNIITASKNELDLRNQHDVNLWFDMFKPDYVFVSAAKVGGIYYNKTYPAVFAYDNIMIQTNIIHASYVNKVKKLLFFGSSCIYPKHAEVPIVEDKLLTGPLESTNEAYALSKILGLKMCEYYNTQYGCNFISCMPCNLYGPNDCFDAEKSHVIPALISKIHTAKLNCDKHIVIWGTGVTKREFLHVDDLSDAAYLIMQSYNDKQFINIGLGVECKMIELFTIISNVVGYTGEFVFDKTQPDGTISKLLDNSRIKKLGWTPKIKLEVGIQETYQWFLKNNGSINI